jgi:hypothetical protein
MAVLVLSITGNNNINVGTWTGYGAGVKEIGNWYKILLENLKGIPGVDGSKVLKYTLQM